MSAAMDLPWQAVCTLDDLQPDSGICALLEGQQIAIFYLAKEKLVFAIQNYDPIGKANVLSRGIIGDIQGQPVVASPLYKQHFNLNTGVCLEDNTIIARIYPIRLHNGSVQVSLSRSLPDSHAILSGATV